MGRRYKRYGELVTVDPPRKVVEEVSVRELSRDTSAVRRLFGDELSDRLRGRLAARRPRDLEWRNRRRVEQENLDRKLLGRS